MQYRETAVVPRESILRAESEWLSSIKADLVVRSVLPCCDSVHVESMEHYYYKGILASHRGCNAWSELGHGVLLVQVSDVVPVVCRVAADMGVRSVCIGNFR